MTPWTCDVCGEHENNRDSWGHCVECSHPRGRWLCVWCGRIGRKRDTACLTCGQKKNTKPPPET